MFLELHLGTHRRQRGRSVREGRSAEMPSESSRPSSLPSTACWSRTSSTGSPWKQGLEGRWPTDWNCPYRQTREFQMSWRLRVERAYDEGGRSARPLRSVKTPDHTEVPSSAVFDRAIDVIGDRQEAFRWLGTPARALDYQTPIAVAGTPGSAARRLEMRTRTESLTRLPALGYPGCFR